MMIKQYYFPCTMNEGRAVEFTESEVPNTFAITIEGKSVFLTRKDAEDIRDILMQGYSYGSNRIEFVAEKNESET